MLSHFNVILLFSTFFCDDFLEKVDSQPHVHSQKLKSRIVKLWKIVCLFDSLDEVCQTYSLRATSRP